MERITFHVVFALKANCLNSFKSVAERFKNAASKEPGTVGYNFYLNAEETAFIFIETYANSEAVITHQNNTTAILADAKKLVNSITLQVLGNPSEALIKLLGNSPTPSYFSWVDGINNK